MVVLYFTIKGKSLDSEKGWKFIQISALLFVLWNLDALIVHFLDNQIELISPVPLSICDIKIEVANNSIPINGDIITSDNTTIAGSILTNDTMSINNNMFLIWLYYFLRLDHLLSVPGMIFLWRGLNLIIKRDAAVKYDQNNFNSCNSYREI